ncbi:hypothetical protein AnigIFM62618_010712 [Aspergillus niger]|nr:hypothetical protein AnigIFM62618_010712 [Aspergillus niger]
MLGIPDQDVQYNQNTFEGAAFTLPESIKDTPHNLQTSNVEEQLRAFRPCPPTEVGFGILPDPELAFFGNVQDQQKGQRPVERHRHRSAIDSCECDRTIKGLLETPKHAHRIVQYQRAKLLDQVEQLLDKVESLYDVGISLEVLVDNNHLRDLLQRAMAGFRSQRDSETHNRGDEFSLIK